MRSKVFPIFAALFAIVYAAEENGALSEPVTGDNHGPLVKALLAPGDLEKSEGPDAVREKRTLWKKYGGGGGQYCCGGGGGGYGQKTVLVIPVQIGKPIGGNYGGQGCGGRCGGGYYQQPPVYHPPPCGGGCGGGGGNSYSSAQASASSSSWGKK